MQALEIGPFSSPLLKGPNVRYCDVLNQAQLKERAQKVQYDPDTVPFIDYVLGPGFLDEIPQVFDAVLSSHAIEHQPDLIKHLQQVQRKLSADGGRYFLLIPDKRYCFDRYLPPSDIAGVLQAHMEQRTVHTLASVIRHVGLTTHNDGPRHWRTPDQLAPPIEVNRVLDGIKQWKASKAAYLDVHAWFFTPDSFCEIVEALKAMGFISFEVERLYSTRYGSNEFWAILKKTSSSTDKPMDRSP
jgi:SAM-dependent methyltransferase